MIKSMRNYFSDFFWKTLKWIGAIIVLMCILAYFLHKI